MWSDTETWTQICCYFPCNLRKGRGHRGHLCRSTYGVLVYNSASITSLMMGSPEFARSTGPYYAGAFAADVRVNWLSIALRKSTAEVFAAPIATFGTFDISYFWLLRSWLRCWLEVFALGRIALTEIAAPRAAVRAVRLLHRAAALGQSAAMLAAAGAGAAASNITQPEELSRCKIIIMRC